MDIAIAPVRTSASCFLVRFCIIETSLFLQSPPFAVSHPAFTHSGALHLFDMLIIVFLHKKDTSIFKMEVKILGYNFKIRRKF